MKLSDSIKPRCNWCLKDDLYIQYHDTEWGVPSHDDHYLFEMLTLEVFQAGLSWYTVLKKRENFRIAFDGFDPAKMQDFNAKDVDRLMQNEGIIRYRRKIEAVLANAEHFLKVQQQHGSFSDFLWDFVNHKPIVNKPKEIKDYLAVTKMSDKITLDLKQKGFKFLGSTSVYAFMQSVGLVNDHMQHCFKSI